MDGPGQLAQAHGGPGAGSAGSHHGL